MRRITCHDFDHFVASVPAVQGRYLQTRRRVRDWHLRIVDLDEVVVFQVRGGASNLFHGLAQSDHYSIYIPVSEPSVVRLCGRPFAPRKLGFISPDHEFHLLTEAPTRWMGIHIKRCSVKHRMGVDEAITSTSVFATSDVKEVPGLSFSRLIGTARRIFSLQESDESSLGASQQRVSAAGQVVEAFFEAISGIAHHRTQRGRHPYERQRIFGRCLALVEADKTRIPTVEDLCSVACVSDRTLRKVFIDSFGMSPHRYLMVRRMHAIRRALRSARPNETVSSICNDYGVWDFGRFARQYRLVYGAFPSQDLGCSP